MRKFKVKVVREEEYEIEIDESVWTQEQLKAFSKVMYQAEDLQELAEIIAEMYFKQGEGSWLEGFGIPYVNGKEPLFVHSSDKDAITKDININEIESDVYIEDINEVIQ